jgi:hypothetical protein
MTQIPAPPSSVTEIAQFMPASSGRAAPAERIVLQDYFDDGSGPRYYQVT